MIYYFKQEINWDQYNYFSKQWIESGSYALSPKASRAILPPLCSYRNSKGVAFPAQSTLAALSGIARKTANIGAKGLKGFPDIDIRKRFNQKGQQSSEYKIRAARVGFPVYSGIFHGGLWHVASSIAKPLHIVQRCYGGLPGDLLETYAQIEEIEFDNDDRADIYKERKWEVCFESKKFLCEKAGIGLRNFDKAIESLVKVGLILPPLDGYHIEGYRVVVKPEEFYRRSFMNKRIKKLFEKGDAQK